MEIYVRGEAQPRTSAYRAALFREPSICFYVHLHFELRLSHEIGGG